MCGRAYATFTEGELFDKYLNEKLKKNPLSQWKANYNFCPSQTGPILLAPKGKREFGLFRWGLVPFWAKDVKSADKYSLINARGEEIMEKRSYKVPFEKRRCVVPVSGFYEWKRTDGKKRPFAIHLKDSAIMSIAGVYEHWTSPDGKEEVNSFALITIAANSAMEKIHDRMPVILDDKQLDEWLDPENTDTKSLQKLLKPCPSQWISSYEISPLVNSPKNNRAEVLDALKK